MSKVKFKDVFERLFTEYGDLLGTMTKIKRVATKQEAEMAKAKTSSNPSIDEIIEVIKGLPIYTVAPHEETRDAIVAALEKLKAELEAPLEMPIAGAGEAKETNHERKGYQAKVKA